MSRQMDSVPVTFATNTSASPPFTLAPYSGAIVLVGTTWNTAMIGFSLSANEAGTYVNVVDNSLRVVGIPAQPSMAIPIPYDVSSTARWVRLVSHSLGNLIAQTAPTVTVLRKE